MFNSTAKELLGLQGKYQCALEEDGSQVVDEVLEAILADKVDIGVIMILKEGEEWSRGHLLILCVY